jgi:hypothetical protein
MDQLPLQVVLTPLIGLAIVVLLWLYIRWLKRRVQGKAPVSGPASDPTATTWKQAVWMVGGLACLAAILMYFSPWTSGYRSRHPPIVEHRSKLVETASKQLNCPAEQLVLKPSGDNGAQVQGCGRTIGLCWGSLMGRRGWGWSVSACYAP